MLLTGKIKGDGGAPRQNKLPGAAVRWWSLALGRHQRFLDVTKAVSDLAKGGPVHAQAKA